MLARHVISLGSGWAQYGTTRIPLYNRCPTCTKQVSHLYLLLRQLFYCTPLYSMWPTCIPLYNMCLTCTFLNNSCPICIISTADVLSALLYNKGSTCTPPQQVSKLHSCLQQVSHLHPFYNRCPICTPFYNKCPISTPL